MTAPTDRETTSDKTERLLATLTELTDDLGRAPTPDELATETAHTPAEYAEQFGSWGRALAQVDLSPPPGLQVPDEHLLDELRRLADALEKVPSRQDMTTHGHHGAETYVNRFGSWNAALEAADLSARPDRAERSRDTLRTDIQRVANDLGHAPTKREIETHGAFAWSTYYDAFGSWNAALEAAGYEPNQSGRTSEAALLAELERLAADGEAPTSTAMQQDGAFSPGTYINRFGSWADALAAAGIETESN